MPRKEPELYEVLWRDAAFDMDDEPAVLILHTVGWILKQNDNAVLIASERSAENDYHRTRTAIPKECIVEMRPLTRRRVR